jgi:hypothetical protein
MNRRSEGGRWGRGSEGRRKGVRRWLEDGEGTVAIELIETDLDLVSMIGE